MTKLKSFLFIILGTMTTGFAIGVFLTPNKIVGGGVSGISTILFHTLNIPTGLSFVILNIGLLLFGIKILGKQFVIKTLVGTGLLSFFIQIFSYLPLKILSVQCIIVPATMYQKLQTILIWVTLWLWLILNFLFRYPGLKIVFSLFLVQKKYLKKEKMLMRQKD